MADRFARTAKFKEEFPKDRGKYYTREQDHPGKKILSKVYSSSIMILSGALLR